MKWLDMVACYFAGNFALIINTNQDKNAKTIKKMKIVDKEYKYMYNVYAMQL